MTLRGGGSGGSSGGSGGSGGSSGGSRGGAAAGLGCNTYFLKPISSHEKPLSTRGACGAPGRAQAQDRARPKGGRGRAALWRALGRPARPRGEEAGGMKMLSMNKLRAM